MTNVLIRMGDLDAETDTQTAERRGHTERRYPCAWSDGLQAEGGHGHWQTPESRKGKEGSSSGGIGESMTLATA